jgi:hypothetical protein
MILLWSYRFWVIRPSLRLAMQVVEKTVLTKFARLLP